MPGCRYWHEGQCPDQLHALPNSSQDVHPWPGHGVFIKNSSRVRLQAWRAWASHLPSAHTASGPLPDALPAPSYVMLQKMISMILFSFLPRLVHNWSVLDTQERLIQDTQWVPEALGFNLLAGPGKEGPESASQDHWTKNAGLPCPWPHPSPRPHWNVQSGQSSCLNKPWYTCSKAKESFLLVKLISRQTSTIVKIPWRSHKLIVLEVS